MKWSNLTKVAFRSILKNRMRSLLTMLGIVIGVASVIAMIGLGEGAQSSVESRIASLGTNLLIIMPGSGFQGRIHQGAGSEQTLSMEDVERLEKQAPALKNISPVISTRSQVIAGRNNWYTTIYGVAPTYLEIRDWKLSEGSFVTDQDVKSRRKIAVLGKTVADQLFPEENPIGARLRIRNVPFTVVGLLAAKGQSATGMDSDDVIITPSTTALYRLGDGETVNFIMASAASSELTAQAQAEITSSLRASHRLSEGEEDDFSIRSQTEITEAATEVTKTFTILLAGIAGVSLLVGGIGIMNIMLVSVTERTREIGIRLAIGARSSDVLIQFLIEAVVMCLLGGFLGIAAGVGISYALCSYLKMTLTLNPTIMIVSFLFAGFVGIFFGFYPARKAALLDPIEALRYE